MGIKVLAKAFTNAEAKLAQGKIAQKVCSKGESLFASKAKNIAKTVREEKPVKPIETRTVNCDELKDMCLSNGLASEAQLSKMNEEELVDLFFNGRKLTVKEKESIMKVYNKLTTDLMINMGKYIKGKSIPVLAENFEGKRSALLKEMRDILTPEQLRKIEKAKNPEKLTQVLFKQEWEPYRKLMSVQSELPKGRVLLEHEQIDYAARIQRGKYIIAREKALAIPSTNPTVVNIEKTLKEQYGVEFVSLNNDEEMAKKVLKGFETASKSGAPLPKNVIISDSMVANGERIATENTILLQSGFAQKLATGISIKALSKMSGSDRSALGLIRHLRNSHQFSTMAGEHVVVHEIMHGTHPMMNCFAEKKIPARFLATKENTSLYSAISPTHETYTELATKRAIEGLNEQENELFNYLNFYS